MKTFIFRACLAACAAGLAGGCGRQPTPAGPALSAPSTATPETPRPRPAADLPSGTPPTASAALPPGTPTPQQQAQITAAAANLQASFDAGRDAARKIYLHDLEQWEAKQKDRKKAFETYDAACRALQRKLADPNLPPEQREELANAPLPPVPTEPPQQPLPLPSNGAPQANQSFDALIYQFRQAVSANHHARAAAVMAQMATLAPNISPNLMAIYEQDAKAYLARIKRMAPAANTHATP